MKNQSNRRDFLAQLLTGAVFSVASGKLLGQVVPRITENPDNDTILAEYVLDLSLAKYADLNTPLKALKVTSSGIAASIIVMRLDSNGKYSVLNDQCTHDGQKMRTTPTLFNGTVFTCSLHGATFDSTGKCKSGPNGQSANLVSLQSYPYILDSANNKLYLNRTIPLSVIDSDNDGFLVRAYPNPASTETVFEFTIDRNQRVTLELYDIQGRLISVIADKTYSSGTNFQRFTIGSLAEGTYTYTLRTADGFITSRTLTVIR